MFRSCASEPGSCLAVRRKRFDALFKLGVKFNQINEIGGLLTMQVPAIERRHVRFGSFEVDLTSRELRNHGCKVNLQEMPFHILAILLAQPGQLVTREEFRQKLWPSDTFVDFDHSINTAVKKLREALEDDAEKPRFIETLPKRGYRFVASAPALDHRGHKRLVVVPFVNLSGAEEDYFSDGLTERMIVQLGRSCKHIDVIAPASVMHYKSAGNPGAIREELAADYLLAGSVLRQDGHVRITARLIRGEDQCCIWSNCYTRADDSVFLLQDELARDITSATLQALPGANGLASRPTTSAAAFEKYLKGRHFANDWSVPGFMRAIRCFEQVIQDDPAYAPAYASLALLHAMLGMWGALPADVVCERLEHFAHKGLGLCDDLEDAHCALGYKYLLFDANWVAVEQHATRAIEINPSYPFGYYLRSQQASVHGQHDFAIAQLRRALELDPLSSIAKTTVSVTCYFAGRLDEARYELEECIDMYPHLAIADTSLAWVYEAMGDMGEALRCSRAGVQLDPQNPVSRATRARALALTGHFAEAREALRELLEETAIPAPSYWIAQVHLALGDVSAAMTCLENAFREKSSWRISAAVDPKLRDLAENPQFRGLLAQVGLAEVWPALRGLGKDL